MSLKGAHLWLITLVALACFGASPAIAQAPNVDFVWSGALQPTSVRIVAGLSAPSDSVRVALTSNESFDEASYSGYQRAREEGRTTAFSVGALEPDTPYRYAVEVDGVDGSVGVETTNGDIRVRSVTGDATVQTTNGDVSVTGVDGTVTT